MFRVYSIGGFIHLHLHIHCQKERNDRPSDWRPPGPETASRLVVPGPREAVDFREQLVWEVILGQQWIDFGKCIRLGKGHFGPDRPVSWQGPSWAGVGLHPGPDWAADEGWRTENTQLCYLVEVFTSRLRFLAQSLLNLNLLTNPKPKTLNKRPAPLEL